MQKSREFREIRLREERQPFAAVGDKLGEMNRSLLALVRREDRLERQVKNLIFRLESCRVEGDRWGLPKEKNILAFLENAKHPRTLLAKIDRILEKEESGNRIRLFSSLWYGLGLYWRSEYEDALIRTKDLKFLDRMEKFFDSHKLHPDLYGAIGRIGDQAVVDFASRVKVDDSNSKLVEHALYGCKSGEDAKRLADALFPLELSDKRVQAFLIQDNPGDLGVETYESRARLLRGYLSSDDHVGYLLKNLDEIKASFSDEFGTSGMNALSLMNEIRKCDQIEFQNLKKVEYADMWVSWHYRSGYNSKEETDGVFRRLGYLLEKTINIEQETRLVKPEDRAEFRRVYMKVVANPESSLVPTAELFYRMREFKAEVERALPASYEAQAKLGRLHGNTAENLMQNYPFNFDHMIGLPLISNARSREEVDRTIEFIRLKLANPGMDPISRLGVIHGSGDSWNGLSSSLVQSVGGGHSQEYIMLRHYIATARYNEVAELFDKLYLSRLGASNDNLFYFEHPKLDLIPAIRNVQNPHAIVEVMKGKLTAASEQAEKEIGIMGGSFERVFKNHKIVGVGLLRELVSEDLRKSLGEEESKKLVGIVDRVALLGIRRGEGTFRELAWGAVSDEILVQNVPFAASVLSSLAWVISSKGDSGDFKAAVDLVEELGKKNEDLLGRNGLISRVFEKHGTAGLGDTGRIVETVLRCGSGADYTQCVQEHLIGHAKNPMFEEILKAVADVVAEEPRLASEGQYFSKYIELYEPKDAKDVEFMKQRFLEVAREMKNLEESSYFLSEGYGGSENATLNVLLGYAKHEKFGELVKNAVRLYASRAVEYQMGFNAIMENAFKFYLQNGQDEFDGLFSTIGRKTAGLDRNQTVNCYVGVKEIMATPGVDAKGVSTLVDLKGELLKIHDPRAREYALEKLFPKFLDSCGSFDYKGFINRYARARTAAHGEDVEKKLGEIDRLEGPAGLKRLAGQSDSMYVWSEEKLKFLVTLRKTRPDYDNAKLAEKLNDKFKHKNVPSIVLLPALMLSHDESVIGNLQQFMSKKKMDGVQVSCQMGTALSLLDKLGEGAPEVLAKIFELGKEVPSGRATETVHFFNGLKTFCNFEDSKANERLLEALRSGKFTTWHRMYSFIKDENIRIGLGKLNIGEEDILKHGLTKDMVEGLLESRYFDIMTALIGNYSAKASDRLPLLKEITIHLIKDDFFKWRYNNDKAVEQLALLGTEEKRIWANVSKTVGGRAELTNEEFIKFRAEMIGKTLEDAVGYLRGIEVGESSLETLGKTATELQGRLNRMSKENKERYPLEAKLDQVRNQENIVGGLLELMRTDFNRELNEVEIEVLAGKINGISKSLKAIGQNEPKDEMTHLLRTLRKRREEFRSQALSAVDTANPLVLLQIGEIPRHSCQSYLNGSHNECLPAYVADANKKAFIVMDEGGKTHARAIGKLLAGKIDGERKSVLLIEPVYSDTENPEYSRLIAIHALEKAAKTGSLLASKWIGDEFREEAAKRGYVLEQKSVEFASAPSHNKSEYSDSYGVQSWTENGYTISAVVNVLRPATEQEIQKTYAETGQLPRLQIKLSYAA